MSPARWGHIQANGVSLSRLGDLGRGPLDPPEPPAGPPAAHTPMWRSKRSLDGTHDLYRVDCSCGYRGAVWYAGEDRARGSWERHVEPRSAAA